VCAPSVAACTRPYCSMRPFGPAPDVAPIRAQTCVPTAMAARDSPSVHARTLCLRLQPHARREFVPGPTHPRLQPVPTFAPEAFAPAFVDARRVRARSHTSAPGVYAHSHQSMRGPTCPRILARVRVQRGHACTSGCTRLIARATSARP
jgi:hypothetical protein